MKTSITEISWEPDLWTEGNIDLEVGGGIGTCLWHICSPLLKIFYGKEEKFQLSLLKFKPQFCKLDTNGQRSPENTLCKCHAITGLQDHETEGSKAAVLTYVDLLDLKF